MNNAKVMVTKEVAEAIEYLRNPIGKYRDDSYIITEHAWITNDENDYWVDKAEPLNNVDVATFARIILNGYTVEKSPEEKVREYYDRCKSTYTYTSGGGSMVAASFKNGQMVGASITLDILGIKIEGVNA